MFVRFIVPAVLGVFFFSTGSCGGGSSGPAAIIDRSGVTVGSISGFGSVIVNGIRFDTTSTSFEIDDRPGSEADLAVGQVVVVQGTVNGSTGVAERITTDPVLQGSIDSIDLANRRFSLLSTVVEVSSTTVVDLSIGAADLSDLNPGDRVTVQGYRGADGVVRATYLAVTSSDEQELQGLVSDLNASASTFSIGSQAIDYTGAALAGFGGQSLANGNRVEVEGDEFDSAGRLIATRIELENEQQFSASDEGTELEIEGLVTRFVNSADFSIGSVAVITNGSTEFSGGNASDIGLNEFIEAEGEVDTQGRLLASEIEFRSQANLKLEATVQSITSSSITVLEQTFTVSATTQYEDRSAQMLSSFSLADVAVDDYVELNAGGSAGSLTLTRLVRLDPESVSTLEGEVSEINQPDLVIQSLLVESSASTQYQIGESLVDVDEFFSELELEESVRITLGASQGGVLQAELMHIDF